MATKSKNLDDLFENEKGEPNSNTEHEEKPSAKASDAREKKALADASSAFAEAEKACIENKAKHCWVYPVMRDVLRGITPMKAPQQSEPNEE